MLEYGTEVYWKDNSINRLDYEELIGTVAIVKDCMPLTTPDVWEGERATHIVDIEDCYGHYHFGLYCIRFGLACNLEPAWEV